MKRLSIIGIFLLMLTFASAKEPYNYPRIFWDHNNFVSTGLYGGYARVIELQDGRLMMLVGNTVSYSSDKGKTWSAKQSVAPALDKISHASPDFIQLSDGTIVIGLNLRPHEPYSEDRLFGIRTVRSTDGGQTWEAPTFVYDAKYEFINGCWEPAFLELPSGELHCYFADESDFTSSSEQCISMCRSFDKGKTWSERTRVCFRAGSRDGMPVPILTANNEIVVIVEDNGWPGYSGFRATTVRCSLEDNWSETVLAGSPNRNMIFEYEKDYLTYHSAAPYLRNHPDGYTIASWMGDHFGRINNQLSTYDMFVAVGDINARNFKGVSAPFDEPINSSGSQWNSVTVLNDGTILAVGNGNEDGELTLARGYLKSQFEVNYGTPVIDGTAVRESYTDSKSSQITLGSKYKNRISADLLYDNEYLYFRTMTIDSDIESDNEIDNDAYELFFDFNNLCTDNTYGQSGMFQLYFGLDGKVEAKAGNNNRWTTIEDVSGIQYVTNIKKVYYETEVAIPWSLFGYERPPVDNTIRFDFRVKDFTGDEIIDITIPDAERRQSWSWMELKLNQAPESGIEEVVNNSDDIKISTNSGLIEISASSEISDIALYATNGVLIYSANNCGSTHYFTTSTSGIAILQIKLDNGNIIHRKITL